MPTSEPSLKRSPIPAGEHVLTLVSVEEREQPAYNDQTKIEKRWTWQFKAQAKDPETGEPYEFRAYTGRYYGNNKATLTYLLDSMLPDWTEEQKARIDTDTILATSYTARIRHEKPDKEGDPPRPRLVYIEPYKKAISGMAGARKPAPEDLEDDLGDVPDPFADQ